MHPFVSRSGIDTIDLSISQVCSGECLCDFHIVAAHDASEVNAQDGREDDADEEDRDQIQSQGQKEFEVQWQWQSGL